MANKKRSNKKKRNTILSAIGIVLILGYLSVVLFGSHGLLTLTDIRGQRDQLIQSIHDDSIQNEKLKNELEKVKNDPEHIERVAREKYNMQKPGEKVFKIEKTDTLTKE